MRFRTLLLRGIAILLLLFPLGIALSLNSADLPSVVLLAVPDSLSWNTAVHIPTNATFAWRENVLAQFLGFSLAESTLNNFVLFFYGTLACFLLLGLRPTSRTGIARLSEKGLLAGLVAVLLPSAFGFDPIIAASVSWLPLLLLSIVWFATSEQKLFSAPSLALALSSILVAEFANQFAPVIATIALLMARSLVGAGIQIDSSGDSVRDSVEVTVEPLSQNLRASQNLQPSQLPARMPKSLPWFAYALVLAPSLVALISAELPSLPQYPFLAHVVPDDNIPGQISALVGPGTALPIIDREALKNTYGSLALLLMCLSIIFVGIFRYATINRQILIQSSLFVAALSICAAIDTLLPEGLAQIGPLAALSRVVPGLFFLPLSPVVLACGLMLLLVPINYAVKQQRLVLSGLAVAVFSLFSLEVFTSFNFSTRTENEQKVIAANYLAKTSGSDARARLVSPSLRLINEYRGRPLAEAVLFTESIFETPETLPSVEVSSNENETKYLFDGDESTRWHSGARSQQPGEWIHLYFDSAVALDGIELATGAWRWDFPRGIEILSAEDCNTASVEDFSHYHPVIPAASWQGKVKFTDTNLPYYGGQDEVQIIFPVTTTSKCLLIRQTEHHPVFQWSVAELRLLKAREIP